MSDLTVLEVWRFPVKSLLGERLDRAELGAEGVTGDRGWALFDVATGFGLTARRVPELLFAAGRLRADGTVEVVLPDGTVTGDDAVLSDWAGRPGALRPAAEGPARRGARPPAAGAGGPRRYETPADAEQEENARWAPFAGADGPFHD